MDDIDNRRDCVIQTETRKTHKKQHLTQVIPVFIGQKQNKKCGTL